MKLTFPKIIYKTAVLLKNISGNLKIPAFYAAVLCVLAFLTGFPMSCQLGREGIWWCYLEKNNSEMPLYAFILCKLLLLFVCCSFFVDFYNTAFNKKTFSWKNSILLNSERLKKIGLLFGTLFVLVAPIALAFAIFLKKANPDWRIEFIYFVIMFICCWIPFIVIRLSAGISYFLSDGKFPSLKVLWQKTEDRNFSIIFSYVLIFVILNFLSLQISFISRLLMLKYFYFSTALITEFFSNLFILFAEIVFMMLFRSMHEILESENSSPSDENSAMDSQKNDRALPEAENDSSRVKKSAKKAKSAKSRKNNKEKK